MKMFLKGLSLWTKKETLSVSCVDNSLISLTDRSIIMSAVRTHLPPCVCTEPRGNRCAVYRPENTWCSAAAHHATAPHTITHTANRCHVQRRTTKHNIWDLNRAWVQRDHIRQILAGCNNAVMYAARRFNGGKESQKTQLDSKAGWDPAKCYSPLEVTSSTDVVTPTLCVCVCGNGEE